MFKLALAFFALLATSAVAEPQFSYEYTGNGSSEFCASEMTQDEREALWVRVLQELEFAGYKAQEVPNQDAREFTNGFYFLLAIQQDDGFCIVYRDAYQPQIPAIRQGPLE